MYIGYYIKFPLFLSNFNGNFFDRFSKNTRISNFMKIRSAGGELFQSDGQTDMKKLTVTFRDFTETLKMSLVFILEIKKKSFNCFILS